MSFLAAADARSADARRSTAETSAFASAVESIAAFDGELVASMVSLHAACEAAVEERLATAEVRENISAAVSAAFDARRLEVSAEALAAIDEADCADGADWDATLADLRLVRFGAACGQLPDGLYKRRDLTALRGFVESRWRACSLDSLRTIELRKARVDALSWAQQHSERVAMARAAADVGRERALAAHYSALAQSDHLPIRVSARLQLPAGRKSAWRVASLNVQEHCADGLSRYVSQLPSVRAAPRRSGAVERLVDAMMHPSVLRCVRSNRHTRIASRPSRRCVRTPALAAGSVTTCSRLCARSSWRQAQQPSVCLRCDLTCFVLCSPPPPQQPHLGMCTPPRDYVAGMG